ncbi:Uncharacterised protein [uncultured archaeon]|nr:Uncharacterised protein [uncultured archaeon]
MNTKNLLVSFLAVASLLLLVATISAADVADNVEIKVDGTTTAVYNNGSLTQVVVPAVTAGDSVTVKVTFTAIQNDSDVTFEAELEGQKVDVHKISPSQPVESGKTYHADVTLTVPSELRDVLSDDLTLNVVLDGNDYKTEIENINLRVQRPSYNPEVKSISFDQAITAGETFPVDIVVKNMGYNELNDVYVTVSIPQLGLQRSGYLGDLVSLESCDGDCTNEDTVSARLYLTVPYDVKPGVYSLEVKIASDSMDVSQDCNCDVSNSDGSITITKQLTITNNFVDNIIVSSTSATVDAGKDAVYSFLIVNPTNQVQVYKITSASSSGVSSTVSDSVVAVPAGSSKTVEVTANAEDAGEYTFSVNVFANDQLAKTIAFNLKTEKDSSIDPIVILTIVLAIIFIVLLIVLIVLIAKKPSKSEEFGESYY